MPALSQQHPAPARPAVAACGVISINEVYRVDEAKRRLGWTDSAYRAATRRGLRVLTSGKRRFISGQDILQFLISESTTSSA